MKTTHRDYSEPAGDFNLIAHFLADHNAAVRRYSTWCIGRFVDWKFGLYESKRAFPSFTEQNAHLWFDGYDRLAGFVISENGDAGIALVTLEGYRFLFEEMLQWALAAWAGRGPRFSIEITEHQAYEAAVLERHGFARTWTFYVRRFDLTSELAPGAPLEPGFSLVDMASHPDYRSQRILRDNAFKDGYVPTEEDLQREMILYNYSHHGPLYHAPTDICVMAPDGRMVAGCEALIDGRNAEADIERVCTHSDFRQRGFARAAIQECLYRLKEMGMRAAYITGYGEAAVALYGSLGATSEMKAYVYEMSEI